MTEVQVFALIGLVMLVSTLVLGEMFEHAIQRHRDEHDSYDRTRTSEVGDGQ